MPLGAAAASPNRSSFSRIALGYALRRSEPLRFDLALPRSPLEAKFCPVQSLESNKWDSERRYEDEALIAVGIEAGTEFGWHKYIGREGVAILIEGFGHSAPAQDLAQDFGFTVDAVVERLLAI